MHDYFMYVYIPKFVRKHINIKYRQDWKKMPWTKRRWTKTGRTEYG